MGQNFASLAYGICTKLSHVLNEKSISRKNLVPRIEKFVSLVLPRKVMFRARLQEVSNILISLKNFWRFGELADEEL